VKRIVVIDNYDSFTYNLVALLRNANTSVRVFLNDDERWREIPSNEIDGIVLSPGPGVPKDAGNSFEVLANFVRKKPVLGVCLGHQVIGEFFGLEVQQAKELCHGKAHPILHDGNGVYKGIANGFKAMRYHSLAVTVPEADSELVAVSFTSDGEVMGLRHKNLQIESVQFHPDSIETKVGQQIINNWVAEL
jgi:anthranilate synthase/aminodeoxychorismate synthase-like glutamine amidotransferase